MSDFDLGTARGKIDLDATGAVKGSKQADDAFKSIGDGADSASKSSAAVGTALVGFGAAAVLAFGAAVKASSDFEKKISEFKSLGADYANNIDAIREKALQLGADTAFSAGEAADALVELGKQGLSTKDILEGAADATVALAAAGGIDLAEAASISAAALNQFKLEAKDLPGIADLLAGAANASATGVSEIGQALKFVGPVANSVGLSIKDTAGAIALLANNGLDAGQAGTALRAILSRLQPASKPAAAAMRELGLITKDGKNQFFDAKGEIKDFADIVGILGGATSKLTAQQKAQALQTIFGTEALAAANVIAGEGKESFLELQKAIGDVRASEVAEEKMNNLAGAIDEFQGSIETAMIRAGAPFQQGLTGIVRAATQVINVFSNLNPEIQKWIGYAVAAAGVAALVVGGIILLQDALVKAKVAFAAFNLVVSNNPVVRFVIILAALAAAIFAAYKNIQPFREAVDRLWDAIQPVFDGIKQKAGEAFGWLTNTALPAAIQKFEELKGKAIEIAGWLGDKLSGPVNTAWTFIQDKIGTAVGWIQNTAVPNIQSAWQQIPEGLGSVVERIEEFLGPKIAGAWENFKAGASTIVSWIQETLVPNVGSAFQGIKDKVAEVAPGVGASFIGSLELIRQGAENVKNWFVEEFVPALQNIFVEKIQPAWQSFIGWIDSTFKPALANAATSVSQSFQGITESINNAVTQGEDVGFFDGLGNRIRDAFNAVTSFLQETVVPKIGEFVNGAIEQFNRFKEWASVNLGPVFAALGELIAAIFSRVGPLIQQGLETAQTVIGVFVGVAIGLWTLFGEAIVNAALAVWGTIRGVIEGALKIITGIIQIATALITGDWGKALEGLKNIAAGIFQAIFAVINGALELIVGVIQGVLNGIRRIWDWAFEGLKSKAQEIWDSVYNTIRDKINAARSVIQGIADFLGNVFHIDLGGAARAIMDSFIGGIRQKIDEVKNLFNSITNLIPDWKGPPQKDAKLLTKNGELIMQSLMDGISSQMGDVKTMMNSVAPMMSSTITPAIAPSPAVSGNVVNINFQYSGGNPDEFVSAVEGSGLIGRLTSAARSRRT